MNKSKKNLIADDQLLSILVLEKLCKGLGHDTVKARNGREAVVLASTERPDCILMDVVMPEMDGLQATEQPKKSRQVCRNLR